MTGETGMKCDMNKDDAIAKLELLVKEDERVLATSQVNTHKRIPEIRGLRGEFSIVTPQKSRWLYPIQAISC